MGGKYWEIFAETGNVEDYLLYRKVSDMDCGSEQKKSAKSRTEAGVGYSESDHGDRDGAVGSAHRRI